MKATDFKKEGYQFHQGDTQWFELTSIPEGAVKSEKKFIAASERSGSFHALFGNYDIYDVDNGFVIDVKEECYLNHSLKQHLNVSLDVKKELEKKDHRMSVVPKGIFFVGIQTRFDPLENARKRVMD